MTLDRAALDRLRDRARQDVDVGLEHGGVEGCSLAIARHGELLFEEGFGAARADTPILLLSITKTIVESALWVLFSSGLDPETPVMEIIPEFMGGTQPTITVAMVETHLAGFAWLPLEYPDAGSRDRRVAAFASWRLEKPTGAYEYNPINAGWVLGEIIERVGGTDYRDFLRAKVLEPLGLAGTGGVSLGEPVEAQGHTLLHRNFAGGYAPDPALEAPMPYGLGTVAGLALGIPGAGGVGTAGGVARLYQNFLHGRSDLWDPRILADAKERIRVDAPDPSGRPMLRSLSFVRAGAIGDRYGERTFFGPRVSEAAFGHQGQGGQIAWADPQTGLSFCYLTNTVVFPPGGCFHPRARELSNLAAQTITS